MAALLGQHVNFSQLPPFDPTTAGAGITFVFELGCGTEEWVSNICQSEEEYAEHAKLQKRLPRARRVKKRVELPVPTQLKWHLLIKSGSGKLKRVKDETPSSQTTQTTPTSSPPSRTSSLSQSSASSFTSTTTTTSLSSNSSYDSFHSAPPRYMPYQQPQRPQQARNNAPATRRRGRFTHSGPQISYYANPYAASNLLRHPAQMHQTAGTPGGANNSQQTNPPPSHSSFGVFSASGIPTMPNTPWMYSASGVPLPPPPPTPITPNFPPPPPPPPYSESYESYGRHQNAAWNINFDDEESKFINQAYEQLLPEESRERIKRETSSSDLLSLAPESVPSTSAAPWQGRSTDVNALSTGVASGSMGDIPIDPRLQFGGELEEFEMSPKFEETEDFPHFL